MRILLHLSALLLWTNPRGPSLLSGRSTLPVTSAFSLLPATIPCNHNSRQQLRLGSTAEVSTDPVEGSTSSSATASSTLSLITFDLDDTLYPIAPVIREANTAFARAMKKYGFPDIEPDDINRISVGLRATREDGALLSHTEMRKLAIRAAMEEVMLKRKLLECAEDWATNVESLGPAVIASAKRWSSKAISASIVDAVLTAWEMERHHAAERHLYPEVLPALRQIKQDYPNAIIGAVTDGKANPMFMTFTLAPFFDFCVNWEDDQGGRRKFFQELSKVEGNAELSWIYNDALERGKEMAEAKAAILDARGGSKGNNLSSPGDPGSVWIHVGDDLAYDVGGSAQCGARTILMELADKYGQTARRRFDKDSKTSQPDWSANPPKEMARRAIMNAAALEFVDERVEFIHMLPEKVKAIVDEVGPRSLEP